jgi:hypothetical protein
MAINTNQNQGRRSNGTGTPLTVDEIYANLIAGRPALSGEGNVSSAGRPQGGASVGASDAAIQARNERSARERFAQGQQANSLSVLAESFVSRRRRRSLLGIGLDESQNQSILGAA